jgi:hypothetical protein
MYNKKALGLVIPNMQGRKQHTKSSFLCRQKTLLCQMCVPPMKHLKTRYGHSVLTDLPRSRYYYSYFLQSRIVGWDNTVSIATPYGLDGPGIESPWGRDLPHPSTPAPGPIQPPAQRVLGPFPGYKAAGAWH